MAKVKRASKAAPSVNKIEINQLIEKELKKALKKIDSLEKAVEKLKGAKKTTKIASAKKAKAAPMVTKKRRSKKKVKISDQDLG